MDEEDAIVRGWGPEDEDFVVLSSRGAAIAPRLDCLGPTDEAKDVLMLLLGASPSMDASSIVSMEQVYG